jgi:hypothetical protein
VIPGPAAHDEISRIRISGTILLDAAAEISDEFEVERLRQAAGDLALCVGEVSAVGLKPVGPNMRAAFRVDQLDVHPNMIAASPYAAFQHIADAEFAADLLHVDRFTLIGKGGAAGDHKASGNAREIGRQVVRDPIGEIFLIRIIRQVLKRQHDDRQPRRGWGCPRNTRFLAHLADEPNAFARHGPDQALRPAIVADRLAHCGDPAGQRRFRHDAAAPHRLKQIVLGDHAVTVLHQVDQEIEDLRLERCRRAAAPQFPAVGVEGMITKAELQTRIPPAESRVLGKSREI